MLDQTALRSTVIATMLEIGELTADQAEALGADPASDFELANVNFDSLIVLDFCLKIEDASGIIVDPVDIAGLQTVNELAQLLAKRRPS
jgi:acyl carrier protein